VRFLILGDPATDYTSFKNVESLGFVQDIARTILRSTVTLQPRLDGALSRLSLETLSHGRHVICRRDWPYSRRAETVEQYVRELRELKHESFNLDGRQYVCGEYDKRPSVGALCNLLTRITDQPGFKRGVLGGWVGVAAILRSPALLTTKEFERPNGNEQGCDDAFRAILTASDGRVPLVSSCE